MANGFQGIEINKSESITLPKIGFQGIEINRTEPKQYIEPLIGFKGILFNLKNDLPIPNQKITKY